MRFARHLAATLLTVAAVVAVGVAWAHASGAGTPNALVPRQGGSGLRLSNSGDLMQTAVIEAVIMAVAITISALRRRRRRRVLPAQRTRASGIWLSLTSRDGNDA